MTLAPEAARTGAARPSTANGATAGRSVVFYDPLSYSAYDHPYEVYRQLRDQAPVYYNPRRDLYVVSRYADVKACLRNHEQMINALGNDMDGTHDSYGAGNLVAQDQPHHSVLRAIVRPSFAGREILAMEDHIRDLARTLLIQMREKGGGDFATEFALPLVFGVSMRLVGAPGSDSPFWQEHLLRSMARTVGQFGIPEDAARSNGEAEEHIDGVVRRRRADIEAGAEADTPDVISQILLARKAGQLEEGEVVGLAHLVLSASTDAPAALLTNCLAVLDKHPQLQDDLRQDPSLIKAFVEETLRYDGPAKNLCRQTTAEITIAGVTIPQDSRVMVLMGSANRDERVYDDPDTFDLYREFTADNKIITFGEGIHSCMGAPLARLTAQVALEEIIGSLDADTEIRIVGVPERWAKQMVRGFAKLPLQFVASPQVLRMRTVTTRVRDRAGTAAEQLPYIESVQHQSTRITLAARQFEAAVRVESKRPVAESVIALTLRELEGEPLPRWEPGAHVDLVLDNAATRQYSLCGDPADSHSWRLGILRDPQGSGGSLYVHDQLHEGDLVRVRGPRNNFPLVASPNYLFIAGGIGITPMLPMIQAADAADARWGLVYGGRQRASMAFLDELARYGDKVSIHPQDELGLLDLPGLLDQPRADTLVYCCGPEPLLAAVEARCAGWSHGSVHVERFVAKPLTEPVLTEAFEVHLAQSELTLTVPPDRSVLSVLEEAGVGVLSSCAEGTCGTCETPVLSGTPDHRDSVLNEDERQSGKCMMICVSRSCTPRLVLNV
jgi:cytochrome P450/ferredoxin-NADP reductase